MELCGSPTYQSSSGLLDAFNVEDFPSLLEIQFPALDIRLSYNDVQFFLATGSTGPSETATEAESSASTASTDPPSKSKDSFRQKTEALLEGVRLNVYRILGSKGKTADGHSLTVKVSWTKLPHGYWITQRACPAKAEPTQTPAAPRLCFIDDCLDCDVPLAELTFSRLYVLRRIGSMQEGKASFTLSGDYYNRQLSGWEPFIEPWPCFLDWQRQAAARLHPPRLKIGV